MKKDNQSLLSKLNSLYTRLFLVFLHNRIHTYHPDPNPAIHQEMSGFLYKLIDEIVNEVSNTYTPSDYKHLKFINKENSMSAVDPRAQLEPATTVSMTLNGLSLYLQKQKPLDNAPRMSEKLKACFWDHVHAAHRYARFGDGRTAKLHADIACNAMKSLSQYMPDDEYSDFIAKFTQELSYDIDKGEVAKSKNVAGK